MLILLWNRYAQQRCWQFLTKSNRFYLDAMSHDCIRPAIILFYSLCRKLFPAKPIAHRIFQFNYLQKFLALFEITSCVRWLFIKLCIFNFLAEVFSFFFIFIAMLGRDKIYIQNPNFCMPQAMKIHWDSGKFNVDSSTTTFSTFSALDRADIACRIIHHHHSVVCSLIEIVLHYMIWYDDHHIEWLNHSELLLGWMRHYFHIQTCNIVVYVLFLWNRIIRDIYLH